MGEGPIRLVIADDEWPWRESVAAVLGRRDELDLVGQADNAERCLELVVKERPAVALIDLRMPEMGGIALAAQIRAKSPDTRVLVLTVEEDAGQLKAALEAGASAFLLKSEVAEPTRLVEAIRLIARGGALLSAANGADVLHELARRQPDDPAVAFGLTSREVEVLSLLAEGLTNREIAERLVIAEQSAKNHVSNLLHKLDAANRTQAVVIARHQGIV